MATEMHKEKAKALELAVSQIERQFGKGAIMKLGEDAAKVRVEAIPTGSIGLDLALGIGGVPRGRVVEIYGPESSGKTTLTLSIIANAQRLGGQVVFIDAEHALDAQYAGKLGVDIENLHVAQPNTGEEALEIAETLVRSGAVDVVAVDSVAALVPKAEIEGEMGDSHMGLQARLMSQALRKLTAAISKSRTCVIFINQIRMQIGVMFGNPETTTGGRALKFYSSVRIDIRRIGAIKEREEVIGSRVRCKVVKNKVAAPFRKAEFDIIYPRGISRSGELLDLAVEKGIVQKSGTWFSYGDERLGQGRENARQFFDEHADVAATVEAELRKLLEPEETAPPVPPAATGATASGPRSTAADGGREPVASGVADAARGGPSGRSAGRVPGNSRGGGRSAPPRKGK
ncbi:MAG: recombinase RecA [Candidatus Eiseniibacteriota bacterium]|jgi:recombination protein RecA